MPVSITRAGRGVAELAFWRDRRLGGENAARVELREIGNEEGNPLLRIVRRGSGSVVTWRRAQIVLLSAQRMSATKVSEVVFTDPDTVREVIHNFNRDGFDALYPRYASGAGDVHAAPAAGDQEDRSVAPDDLGRPLATWSLAKLADYLVAEPTKGCAPCCARRASPFKR